MARKDTKQHYSAADQRGFSQIKNRIDFIFLRSGILCMNSVILSLITICCLFFLWIQWTLKPFSATWRLERAKRTGVMTDCDLTVKSGTARSTRSKSKGFLTQSREDAKKNSFRDEWDEWDESQRLIGRTMNHKEICFLF